MHKDKYVHKSLSGPLKAIEVSKLHEKRETALNIIVFKAIPDC